MFVASLYFRPFARIVSELPSFPVVATCPIWNLLGHKKQTIKETTWWLIGTDGDWRSWRVINHYSHASWNRHLRLTMVKFISFKAPPGANGLNHPQIRLQAKKQPGPLEFLWAPHQYIHTAPEPDCDLKQLNPLHYCTCCLQQAAMHTSDCKRAKDACA